MSQIKIFNDPIYGLVSLPFTFIYTLIDHPYLQRLRRIQQLGMSSIVYPGATHTRFHHALGALHLCDRLIQNLRLKQVDISDEEYLGALIATLLHDIGHGPFSHALEGEILTTDHESLTLHIMRLLDQEYDGQLSLAIKIFSNTYYRPFLSQMVSGQLDVDRMDYLNRDSFYTGVAEGVIGYDRIIKMMTVADDQLVVEEKGLYSIEKFLMSRHFMYYQVYLHHASIAADQMLKRFIQIYQRNMEHFDVTERTIDRVLYKRNEGIDINIKDFLLLDDTDIIMLLKKHIDSNHEPLRILANGLLNRKLFKLQIKKHPFSDREVRDFIKSCQNKLDVSIATIKDLVISGNETNEIYQQENEIKILKKANKKIVPYGRLSRLNTRHDEEELYFIAYPRASHRNS